MLIVMQNLHGESVKWTPSVLCNHSVLCLAFQSISWCSAAGEGVGASGRLRRACAISRLLVPLQMHCKPVAAHARSAIGSSVGDRREQSSRSTDQLSIRLELWIALRIPPSVLRCIGSGRLVRSRLIMPGSVSIWHAAGPRALRQERKARSHSTFPEGVAKPYLRP